MKKWLLTLLILMLSLLLLSTCAKTDDRAIPQNALIKIVENGESKLFTVSPNLHNTEMKELPIGIFDSGMGGLTVLETILKLDVFSNLTHKLGPDGRPDFENERFVYLGDQANMPYGNYSSEEKTDFLQELIIKDVVFLLGERYWPSANSKMPRYDKPPVKAIVIACNTATAYGLETVRTALKEWQLPVEVIGIVEAGAASAVKAFSEQSEEGVIAVLATVGTCRNEGYIRAIKKHANEANIMTPTIIQQGCLGLAGAIESDPSYISLAEVAQTEDYRGPAVGNQVASIDPSLLAQYNFEAEGLLGYPGPLNTWRLNSVENYIRYHTTSLLEQHLKSDYSKPINTVVLGCTHFPYFKNEITESLKRLRDFREPNGKEPYRNLIIEQPSFIDPAELAAKQLYETLSRSELLIDKSNESILSVDEFYISIPNSMLSGIILDDNGGFTYKYKYSRVPGKFELEYVKRVPMSSVNLSSTIRDRIKMMTPLVWSRLVAFNQKSPRIQDLPDSARIRLDTSN